MYPPRSFNQMLTRENRSAFDTDNPPSQSADHSRLYTERWGSMKITVPRVGPVQDPRAKNVAGVNKIEACNKRKLNVVKKAPSHME